MGKRLIVFRFICFMVALPLIVLFTAMDKAEANTTELKLVVYQGPLHLITQNVKRISPWVEKMTDGRVKVKVFDSGTLGKGESLQEVVQKGVVDIAGYNYAYGSEKNLPFTMLPQLPFVARNEATYINMWQKEPTLQNMMNEYFAESGYDNVEHFGNYFVGTQFILLKKFKPKVPADFAGIKLRTVASLKPYFDLCGVKTIVLPVGETYEALQRGILDGTTSTFSNVVDWKWGETADYILKVPVYRATMNFLINKKSLAKLSQVDQNILKAIFEWGRDAINCDMLKKEITGLEWAKKHNMTIHEPTEKELEIWIKYSKPYIEKWLSLPGVGDRGRKALKIVEKYNQATD